MSYWNCESVLIKALSNHRYAQTRLAMIGRPVSQLRSQWFLFVRFLQGRHALTRCCYFLWKVVLFFSSEVRGEAGIDSGPRFSFSSSVTGAAPLQSPVSVDKTKLYSYVHTDIRVSVNQMTRWILFSWLCINIYVCVFVCVTLARPWITVDEVDHHHAQLSLGPRGVLKYTKQD